jgi:superfamily II DNA or RNA helicase
MTPRPYQLDTINAVCAGWKQFRKQLVVLPTGSGKTIIFSWLAQREAGRTLILAHREELIDQAIAKLHSATGLVAYKEKAEYHASKSAKVVVASVQTMIRRLADWPADHFGLVVADEAHHAIGDSWQAVLRHFDAHGRVLGVTATPDRGDERNLGSYFENVAHEVSLFDLINQGHLSRIAVRSVPLQIDLSGVKQKAGDFSDADLGSALEPYLPPIARAIKEYAPTRRVLAFLPLIATSHKFVSACQAAGINARHIDGYSSDRADILRRFAGWEFDLLSNAMLLTEGFDDPSIDCVVVLRPTRSRPLFAQMIGRGTRTDCLKDDLLLLDFLWLHNKHSVTRPAHLIAKSEDEADAITQIAQDRSAAVPGDVADTLALDLGAMAGAATKQREENLRKRLEEQSKKRGKYISAEEFALTHHDMVTAEFEPTMRWHSDAITDSQMKWLKRAHIDPATVRGKGHASALLTLYFSRQNLVLASPKQRHLLRRMGHPSPDTATAREARQFFANKKQNL